jgi:hypothetical protein
VPQAAPPEPGEPTGIDYLGLVMSAEEKAQGSGRIDYAELRLPGFDDNDNEEMAQ